MPPSVEHTNIPWYGLREWEELRESIKRVEKRNKNRWDSIQRKASHIRFLYENLSEPIEEICHHTCTSCKDICCKRATIWYDLKDLIYLNFALNRFPEFQIRKQKDAQGNSACCYFSDNGCLLDRLERPFVCTWYFCPTQTEYLSSHSMDIKQTMDLIFAKIKNLRREIKDEFKRVSKGENV